MSDFSQRQRFKFYLDALNRDDLEGVAACYAPDLHLTDDHVDLWSCDAVMAFHRRFTSRVELLNYVDRPGRIAAEIRWTLDARAHPTDPLTTGETRTWASFIMIDIADGRFTRIRSAPYRATP